MSGRPLLLPEGRSVNAPNAPADLADSPRWLAFDLEPATGRTLLLNLDEEEYRAASFLDQRAVKPGATMTEARWQDVVAAMPAGARRDAQYIFHLGNVGSTLISRLLGELEDVFALREPLLLRVFAAMIGPGGDASKRWDEHEAQARVDTLRALLSRTFRPPQRAIVKATSFTSEIASHLLPAGSRALFLYASAQHYIENILAGPNSRQALELLSPSRLERLATRCPGLKLDLRTLTEGRKAALGWACEMSSLNENAARLPPESVKWVDFDLFLTDPVAHFTDIAGHFGHEPDGAAAQRIAAGPLMGRYSKALEYEFSPRTRREILAEARRFEGPAIRDALVWLNGLAARYPAVAAAIRRSQQRG
jgi:hypothetical protein